MDELHAGSEINMPGGAGRAGVAAEPCGGQGQERAQRLPPRDEVRGELWISATGLSIRATITRLHASRS